MNIEQKRKAKNLTQKQLAEICGTSQNNISRYETGARSPSLKDAKVLANALGCSIDELLQEPEEETAASAA